MVIIDYSRKYHKDIIKACVLALSQGKVVAYPTDTCYGLAADTKNIQAVKKLYEIKGRKYNKPSSVVVPSVAYAKKIVNWNIHASKLVKKFWPGAVTLVLSINNKVLGKEGFAMLTGNSEFLGVRMPNNGISLDLAKYLKKPITATSANVSGMPECYEVKDILAQFKNKKLKPDIIINFGKLKKQKPSTVVRISYDDIKILRVGPISEKEIGQILEKTHNM